MPLFSPEKRNRVKGRNGIAGAQAINILFKSSNQYG